MDHQLIGENASLQKIRELISMVSETAFNVLLLGETGTGKEVIARYLHQSSSRRDKRFVKVNCAALPLNLLESELFGYERGAFTGADRQKPGKFELASGGVMFLDEIGDMPMVLQAKLLQVLQSGEFNRLGGTEDVKVNTWVVASTNHDLDQDMKKGHFREDLYYRLNIIKIELPPLRERREDIGLLTRYFITKFQTDLNLAEGFRLDQELEKLFDEYPWPGNVRELSSTILKLMVGDNPEVVKQDLLNNMKAETAGRHLESRVDGGLVEQEGKIKATDAGKSLMALRANTIERIEKRAILYALNKTNWNKREAAKLLKISYKALFYKMANLGIGKEKELKAEGSKLKAREGVGRS